MPISRKCNSFRETKFLAVQNTRRKFRVIPLFIGDLRQLAYCRGHAVAVAAMALQKPQPALRIKGRKLPLGASALILAVVIYLLRDV